MKTTADGEIAKMRVELDVTPTWWDAKIDTKRMARAFALACGRLPRVWRVTATMKALTVHANVGQTTTLADLEKSRTGLVRELEALTEEEGN